MVTDANIKFDNSDDVTLMTYGPTLNVGTVNTFIYKNSCNDPWYREFPFPDTIFFFYELYKTGNDYEILIPDIGTIHTIVNNQTLEMRAASSADLLALILDFIFAV